MKQKQIEVFLIAGFTGSRKTIFFKNLLKRKKKEDNSVIQQNFGNDSIQDSFKLKKTISLVNVAHIEEQLEKMVECERQNGASDILVLNKTDLIPKLKFGHSKKLIEGINPSASMELAVGAAIVIDLMKLPVSTECVENNTNFNNISYRSQLKTLILEFDEEFGNFKLKATTPLLLAMNPQKIYRMKGFVKIKNSSVRHLLQSSGKLFTKSSFDNLPGSPYNSKLTIVGRDIRRKEMAQLILNAKSELN